MNLNMETQHLIRSDQIFKHFMIQSQIIRKLNPMKSPRIPPQSATREPNGNAISSFKTCTVSLRYSTSSVLLSVLSNVIAFSIICAKIHAEID